MSEAQPDEPEIKFTGNIRRLRLRPGDTLVLEVPAGISAEQVAPMMAALKEKFPGCEVIALGGGIRAATVIAAPKVAVARLAMNGSTAGLLG